jgi:ABC-type bacteriocin/lantibiotic exporter with double-glycine peptidase domain
VIDLLLDKLFSLNKLRNLAQTDRMGASLSSLADAAETLGYNTLPVRASLSKLELQPNPWIAQLICDPAIGKRSLLRPEFEANWTGYALLLFPTKHLNAQRNEKVSLREFWHAFWHHRELLGQIVLASVLLTVFGLAAPLITQVVLDKVLPYKSSLTLNIFAFGFLFFGIWRISVQAVRQYLLDYFSNRMDLTLLGGFISHTLRLPLQFFVSRQPGDIITLIQENRKIQLFFTKQALSTTLDALMVIVYLGLMAYYNLRLTLIVLLLILPIVIVTAATSPLLKNASRELYQKSAVQYSTMLEIVTSVATVKTAAAVCFRYNANAEHNTLHNISFQIKAGQTVGIVGTNGSGKSTLVNLLAGLYRPHSGRILIDGHNIAEVSPQSLRGQLGVVPQDIFLFAGSILENITLFNSEVSLEEAIAAAKVAEAHTFIQALPLGYNTRVSEGGMMLADEQRQKIAIARTLVRNPRILNSG